MAESTSPSLKRSRDDGDDEAVVKREKIGERTALVKLDDTSICYAFFDAAQDKVKELDRKVDIHPKTREVLSRGQYVQRGPAWYEIRGSMLSASDFGSVLGHNRYCSRNQVLKQKAGLKARPNLEGNKAIEHGFKNESRAIQKFEEVTGKVVFDIGLLIHPTYSFLGGSPDGITACGSLIEVKCPLLRKIEPDAPIPEYYMDQMQGCMHVAGIDKAYYIEYRPPNEECIIYEEEQLKIVEVKADPKWVEENIPKLKQFWLDVVALRKKNNAVTLDKRIVLEEKEVQPRKKAKYQSFAFNALLA